MNLEQFTPIARHMAQIFAGFLVGQGYVSEEMSTQIVGVGVGLFTLGAYFLSKSRKALKEAE